MLDTFLSALSVSVLHNNPIGRVLFSFTDEGNRAKFTKVVSAKTRKSDSRICALKNVLLLPYCE